MKAWFSQFNPREQLSLLALGMALSAYLLYMLLWSPLQDLRDQMEIRNQGVATLLLRVDSMVSEIIHLREGGSSNGSKRNLTVMINTSTTQAGLSVSRLQPNSRGEVQVRIEGEAFDDILSWLHTIEMREGLLLREVSITQAGADGRVNATVRIAQRS